MQKYLILSINSGASVISGTDANAEDVLGDGTVSYDRETNTLTLNNAELVPEGSPSAPAIYVSAANKGLNLNVVGKNTISHDQCMSINGQLNISGEGTLDVTGKTYAIMATGGITIDWNRYNGRAPPGPRAAVFIPKVI